MTPEILQFIDEICTEYPHIKIGKTLEVGSMDINGSIRHHFSDYVGIDMRPGKNVDRVANGHRIPFESEFFDTVICLEMIEHDDRFWITILEISRVLRSGGMAILTAPTIGFARHDYPSDYWRFTEDGLKVLLSWGYMTPIKAFVTEHTAFAIGMKG